MAVDAADLGATPLFSSLSERDLEQLAAWFDTRMASPKSLGDSRRRWCAGKRR